MVRPELLGVSFWINEVVDAVNVDPVSGWLQPQS